MQATKLNPTHTRAHTHTLTLTLTYFELCYEDQSQNLKGD